MKDEPHTLNPQPKTLRFVVEITRSFKPTYEQQIQHLIAAHINGLTNKTMSDAVRHDPSDVYQRVIF